MNRDELLKLYIAGKRDFSNADLPNADFRGANLRGADLRGANLRGANLRGANLSGAYLSGADLSGADLSGVYLSGANLSGADLSGVYLSGANLSGADLSGADLSNTNLSYTYLSGADLSNTTFADVVIKHMRVFSSIYRYQVWAIIAEDDSEWIRLGCFFRKREEWESDFWNNDKEFPNDNSAASNMRLAAFNFACKWIDERKRATERKS